MARTPAGGAAGARRSVGPLRVVVLLAAVLVLILAAAALRSRTSPAAPGEGDLISAGAPAFASSGAADNANDPDLASSWGPDGPGWLAYDLAAVPADRRQAVVLAWYTSPDDGHSVVPLTGVCPVWSGRPYLADYVIEGNSAPSGPVPEDGWVTLESVKGNAALTRLHEAPFKGLSWIRLRGTGPNGISVNVDVADARDVERHGWLFLGDSITAMYAGHVPMAGPDGQVVDGIAQLVTRGSHGAVSPIVENGGTACARASDVLGWVDGLLDASPAHYVTLNFGTNDGWEGAGDPRAFGQTMAALVDKVIARGKVPVVPTIPWPNNGDAWQAGIEAMNDEIRQLTRERPDVVAGPDLYALLKEHPEFFRAPGDVHPNELGSSEIRQAWAETVLRTLPPNGA